MIFLNKVLPSPPSSRLLMTNDQREAGADYGDDILACIDLVSLASCGKRVENGKQKLRIRCLLQVNGELFP